MRRIAKWAAVGLMAVVGVAAAAPGATAGGPVAAYAALPQAYSYNPGHFPAGIPNRRDTDYAVYVRHGLHWHLHGRYETLRQAEHVERHLEREGHRVRIEAVRDGGPGRPW